MKFSGGDLKHPKVCLSKGIVRLILPIFFGYFLRLTLRLDAVNIRTMNQPFASSFYFYFSNPLTPQLAERLFCFE
jgi:hypothetical protein